MLPFDCGVDCAREMSISHKSNGYSALSICHASDSGLARPSTPYPVTTIEAPALTPPAIRSGVWRSVAQRSHTTRPSRATE